MNKENTQVSIVILTKNGGELLEKSVRMIFQQEASFNYEVIVIDSGSTDGTLEVLKKYPVFVFKVNLKLLLI